MNAINRLIEIISNFLLSSGLSENLTNFFITAILTIIVVGLAIIADIITKKILVSSIRQVFKRTKSTRHLSFFIRLISYLVTMKTSLKLSNRVAISISLLSSCW